MPAAIKIREIRFSSVHVNTILDLLAQDKPGDKLSFLRRASGYKKKFAELVEVLKSNKANDLDYTLPWNHPTKHHYWAHYMGMGRTTLAKTDPEYAWTALVPLRKRILIATPEIKQGRTILEVFYYPHGVAFVLTFIVQGEFTLTSAADYAIKLHRESVHEISWDKTNKETVPTRELNDRLMSHVLAEDLGVPDMDYTASDPLTIFTVYKAEGVNLEKPVIEDQAIHRFLNGVTTWSPTWKKDKPLPSLSSTSLNLRPSPASHTLYGRERGRAIWFPNSFTETSDEKTSVNCYHRNLLFAFLQTESLSSLAIEALEKYDKPPSMAGGRHLSTAQEECVGNAVDMLETIYAADDRNTYRSWSPIMHIDQNEYIWPINQMRDYLGKAEIESDAYIEDQYE